jgi:phage-related protein
MTPRHTFTLRNLQQGHEVLRRAWEHCKPWLAAGHRLVVEVRPATRSTDQNSRLHAVLGDIAKQVEWSGARRDIDTWKRLMTAAWLRARGESVEFLPAIDGHGVDIVFRRTSTLTVAECGELMEFVEAWGSERGVLWSEPVHQEEPA